MKRCETVDHCPLEVAVGAQDLLFDLKKDYLKENKPTGEIDIAVLLFEKIKKGLTRCPDCLYQ